MTLSPDGKWFWNGNEWIPAPPSNPAPTYTPPWPPSTPPAGIKPQKVVRLPPGLPPNASEQNPPTKDDDIPLSDLIQLISLGLLGTVIGFLISTEYNYGRIATALIVAGLVAPIHFLINRER